MASVFTFRLPSLFFRYVCLNRVCIRTVYRHTHNAKKKLGGLAPDDLRKMLDVEVGLWQSNDVRTYMQTSKEFLSLDNCNVPVDLPVYHVAMAGDRYFDNQVVEQHFRVIFSSYHLVDTLKIGNRAPAPLQILRHRHHTCHRSYAACSRNAKSWLWYTSGIYENRTGMPV